MSLHIYSTLSREKAPFTPLTAGKVRMYVCGVTVYDYCHLGHARAYIVFDVIYRWLRQKGWDVTYVRNFTDVDDKIIKRANDRGVTAEAISKQFIDAFHEDMEALGTMPATIEPRATEHIPEMIEVIRELEKKGIAYRADDGVYFSVSAYPKYGRLSRRNLDDLRDGARVAVDDKKRDPADFALWKAAKPGEPAWDSPWGKGRPGWHIECSAMARRYLGQPFDLHGGGADLVFPHHENEIAQSEGAYDQELSRVWLHNAFLNIDSEKMSKSLGNFKTIREALKQYDGETIRLFMLRAHYRTPVDFTAEAIADAQDGLLRLYKALAEAEHVTREHQEKTLVHAAAEGPENEAAAKLADELPARFAEAMDDDFNTAGAVAVLFEAARAINRLTSKKAVNSGEHELVRRLRNALRDQARVVGLLAEDPKRWLERHEHAGLASTGLSAEDVEKKIDERRAARAAKDFKKADEIRKWLEEKGIVLEDSAKGPTWRRK